VRTLTVFGPSGLTVSTSGDVLTATCAGPSAVLAGRAGFVQCAPDAPAPVLDPCVVSPTDSTLVACIGDPQQPVRLVRATTPQPHAEAAPGPPFLAVVLSGGDVCTPVAPPGAAPPPTTTTTTAAVGTPTTSTAATSTTTASSTTATTTVPTTTTIATTAPTAPPDDATAAVPAYRCTSGVAVLAQPNTSASAWTVPIAQPSAPNRTVTVTAAWS
jgi:hypothetical protein